MDKRDETKAEEERREEAAASDAEVVAGEGASLEAEEGGVEAPSPLLEELEDLRQRVATQNQRIDELSRAYAELLNDRESFRRRLERESQRQVESTKADVAQVLFDAMDDLRRAIQGGSGDAAAVTEGVRLIADGLQRRLEGMGVTAIPTEGQLFDPILHEAVDLVPTSDREADGKVVEDRKSVV